VKKKEKGRFLIESEKKVEGSGERGRKRRRGVVNERKGLKPEMAIQPILHSLTEGEGSGKGEKKKKKVRHLLFSSNRGESQGEGEEEAFFPWRKKGGKKREEKKRGVGGRKKVNSNKEKNTGALHYCEGKKKGVQMRRSPPS